MKPPPFARHARWLAPWATMLMGACAVDAPIGREPVRPAFVSPLLRARSFLAPLVADRLSSPARPSGGEGFVLEGRAPAHRGRRPVAVVTGANASDAVAIRAGGAEIGVVRKGATAARGVIEQGVVAYERAVDGADVLVVSRGEGIEELLVARERELEVSYEIGLPPGWSLSPHTALGLVEVLDEQRAARMRVVADRAWAGGGRPVPLAMRVEGSTISLRAEGDHDGVVIDPYFVGASSMVVGRTGHAMTPLLDGRLLVSGGGTALAEVFDPKKGSFTLLPTSLSLARLEHAAARLGDGRVLIVGGTDGAASTTSVDAYDPAMGDIVQNVAQLTMARAGHTATALADGRVLVAGGEGEDFDAMETLEVFDGEKGAFSLLSPRLSAMRRDHTATVLVDGRVLVAGGSEYGLFPSDTADLVDVAAGKVTAVSKKMVSPRSFHTATLLPGGSVLLSGGDIDVLEATSSAELFDPAKGAFSATKTTMSKVRTRHAAALLPDGRVLLLGGEEAFAEPTASAEVFDPKTRVFKALEEQLAEGRALAAAVSLESGKVLVTGGEVIGGGALATTEVFDPSGVPIDFSSTKLCSVRADHGAAPLGPGHVLFAGGRRGGFDKLDSLELFDVKAQRFRPVSGRMSKPRRQHTVTDLGDGRALIAGGNDAALELFDRATGEVKLLGADLSTPRSQHTATRLDDGSVLIAGGEDDYGEDLDTIELVYPDSAKVVKLASRLSTERVSHTATLLPDGRVLLAGGRSDTIDLFDPATKKISVLPGSMDSVRTGHTATLLDDGSVLLAGGESAISTDSLEVCAPSTGKCKVVSDRMQAPRAWHTATLLDDGKVLLAGGRDDSADLFDPATRSVEPVAARMGHARATHTATLIEGRKVLLAGGYMRHPLDDELLDAAELYDIETRTFAPVGVPFRAVAPVATELGDGRMLLTGNDPSSGRSLVVSASGLANLDAVKVYRTAHAAALKPPTTLLLVGGLDIAGKALASCEERSIDGQLRELPSLGEARAFATATVLPGGAVLVAGGDGGSGALDTAELLPAEPDRPWVSVSLGMARSRHAAALLPDGSVLLVGGVNLEGDVPIAQLFEPTTRAAAPVGEAAVGADPSVAFVGERQIVVAGPRKAVRFDVDTRSFTTLATDPGGRVAMLPTGDVLACGTLCRFLGSSSLTGGEARPFSLGLSDMGKPMGTEGVVFVGTRSQVGWFGQASLRIDAGDRASLAPVPGGARRAGDVVMVEGKGWPSPDSASFEARVKVAWRPLDGAGPVHRLEARAWGASSFEVVVPRTVYTGQGWLYVIVDGVPSPGVPFTMAPQLDGASCSLSGECASGHCVDEVCCDTACVDGCRACSAKKKGQGSDGACGPIAVNGLPRSGCERSVHDVCSPLGTCDGKGGCALPPETTPCTAVPNGRCVAGVCAAPPPATCDDEGEHVVFADGSEQWCQPFRCSGGACATSCTTDADCAKGAECAGGVCKASCDEAGASVVQLEGPPIACVAYRCRQGACLTSCDGDGDCAEGAECRGGKCGDACSADGTAVTSVTGEGVVRRACNEYRCRDGLCLAACLSHGDCAPGHACSTQGRCERASMAPDERAGACSHAPGAAPRSQALLALVLLAAAARARRARREAA